MVGEDLDARLGPLTEIWEGMEDLGLRPKSSKAEIATAVDRVRTILMDIDIDQIDLPNLVHNLLHDMSRFVVDRYVEPLPQQLGVAYSRPEHAGEVLSRKDYAGMWPHEFWEALMEALAAQDDFDGARSIPDLVQIRYVLRCANCDADHPNEKKIHHWPLSLSVDQQTVNLVDLLRKPTAESQHLCPFCDAWSYSIYRMTHMPEKLLFKVKVGKNKTPLNFPLQICTGGKAYDLHGVAKYFCTSTNAHVYAIRKQSIGEGPNAGALVQSRQP